MRFWSTRNITPAPSTTTGASTMTRALDAKTIRAAHAALAKAFMQNAITDADRFREDAAACEAREREALGEAAAARSRGDEDTARAYEKAAEGHRIDARTWRELAHQARLDVRRALTRAPMRAKETRR
jgi:LDH2 family malate/lactate/ureidoglycolate dehydrogenase